MANLLSFDHLLVIPLHFCSSYEYQNYYSYALKQLCFVVVTELVPLMKYDLSLDTLFIVEKQAIGSTVDFELFIARSEISLTVDCLTMLIDETTLNLCEWETKWPYFARKLAVSTLLYSSSFPTPLISKYLHFC